jgi:GR25 family glycosyltransferase involved in LPS biosynthesis
MKSGNAEVLLLGVLPFQKGFGVPIATYYQPSIIRQWTMTICAHAYLLTRRAMWEILQFADSRKGVHHPRMHFDMIFHFLKMKVHSVYPMICFQNKDPAMYQRIQTMVPLLQCISFRSLSTFMNHLSLMMPVFLAILFSVCLFFLSRRTYRLLRQPRKNNNDPVTR